ncbi:cyclic di-GMP phosphodiesterase [Atlantibacter hermannii]|uniref:cyclic di-GMP phosphodiesterase n=1 Tax=Atlantibacter hermannii TaxID=565 RepID=UPI0028A1B99D|nr:cyclic di-GMP phosphodiesterase [Atlantibacter hermannii]
MRAAHIFERYLATPRKIILISIMVGLLLAICASVINALWLHHKREQSYDILTHSIREYVHGYFHDLEGVVTTLQPLTVSGCNQVSSDLTSQAAFNTNVRAFVLVDNGTAYCSSATGAMSMPVSILAPGIDIKKSVDMAILPGTTMVPGKPTIVIWFQNPAHPQRGIFTTLNVNLTPYLLFTARHRDAPSMALVVGDKAITTRTAGVHTLSPLSAPPLRIVNIAEYPIQLYVYGKTWSVEDVLLSVLAGTLFGLGGGVVCGYILYNRQRSGKEIMQGMRRNQFYIVWQPVVESEGLTMTGVEVLMRWEHPDAGTIPPDAFISFAEAQQLIVPLTRHLFTLIAKEVPLLKDVLPPGGKIGINIAPGHLHSPEFKEDIRQFAAPLPSNDFQIVFEITERDMIEEQQAASLFEWLHQQGFEIAVDDFGTGHSALIYLERFTMDYLKIDRGFVNAIGTETVTSPVLDAVITLARRLNMMTVAEGVETCEQAKWLKERGVNYLQGFYFSRPMRVAQLIEWQRKRSVR